MLVALLVLFAVCDSQSSAASEGGEPPSALAAADAATPGHDASRPIAATLEPGSVVELVLASLPADDTLVFELRLGAPSADTAPRPARIVAQTGAFLEIECPLGERRTTAILEVPRSFLAPGHYLIEVRTTEATHFPVRRYVVKLR